MLWPFGLVAAHPTKIKCARKKPEMIPWTGSMRLLALWLHGITPNFMDSHQFSDEHRHKLRRTFPFFRARVPRNCPSFGWNFCISVSLAFSCAAAAASFSAWTRPEPTDFDVDFLKGFNLNQLQLLSRYLIIVQSLGSFPHIPLCKSISKWHFFPVHRSW